MKKKRRYLCCVALGSKLYAIGGYDGTGRLSSVECYDVITQEWTPSASMIHRRGLAGAAVLNGMTRISYGMRLRQSHNLSTRCVRNRLVASLSTSCNNAVILSSCYKVVTHS